MLNLSKSESKETLLKKGFPEQLIEKLAERQKNGEKLPTYIRFTDAGGNKRFERIPDSLEEIEEKKKAKEKSQKHKRECHKKWLNRKTKENPNYRKENNDEWAKKKGYKNYNEYENSIYHGFNNAIDYYNYLSEMEKLKKEKINEENIAISNLSNEMKGYIAGFFDAEGCIRTDKSKGRLHVIINQTYFPVLKLIDEIFNGSITELHSQKEFRKQAWCWTSISEKAIPFLELIYPYSIEKRKQIELAIKYQKEVKINHKGGSCKVKITTEEHQQREHVYNELQKLKNSNETDGCYIPKMPKDIEIGYLAGFFDGEGCVRINKDNRSEGTYTLYVSISNSNFSILKLYQTMFGGSVIEVNVREEHYKKNYQWRVVAQKALSFIKIIEPYTIVKREQIKTAIEFKELQNLKFPYIGKLERKEKGEQYYNKLRELKKESGKSFCNDSNNTCTD